MGSNVLLSQDFSASKFSMIILTTIQSGPGPAPPRQQHHQRRRRAPCRPAGRDPGSRRASPCPPRLPPGSAEAARQGQEAQRHEGGGTNRAAAAPRGPRSRFSFAGKRGPAAPRLPSSCSSAEAGGHRARPRNAPAPLSRRAKQNGRASEQVRWRRAAVASIRSLARTGGARGLPGGGARPDCMATVVGGDGGGGVGRSRWLCPEWLQTALGREESLLGSGGDAVITKRVSEKQKRGRVLPPPL